MMKLKLLICVALILSLSMMCSCAYVHTKVPFDDDLNLTELGTKKGTAEAYGLFWLVAWGDASYATAAKNGGIKVLRHADQEVTHVLFGLYTRWRVIVYGD